MKVGDLVWYVGWDFNRLQSESYGPRLQDIGIVLECITPEKIKVCYPAEKEWTISVNQREDLRILNETR